MIRACTTHGEMRNTRKIFVGKPKPRWGIISEWILGKWGERLGAGFIRLRIWTCGALF
jgi:hypothetical protein